MMNTHIEDEGGKVHFIFTLGFVYLLWFFSKPILYSEEKYRDYFTRKWEGFVAGKTFEIRLKQVKMVQTISFWITLLFFISYLILVIVLHL